MLFFHFLVLCYPVFYYNYLVSSNSSEKIGQVVGGNVVAALVVSGPVITMVAWFGNVAYERLPLDEDEAVGAAAVVGWCLREGDLSCSHGLGSNNC
ncbi:hypothetical protein AMTRI_Chr04g188440 [Amborella trichopoda]